MVISCQDTASHISFLGVTNKICLWFNRKIKKIKKIRDTKFSISCYYKGISYFAQELNFDFEDFEDFGGMNKLPRGSHQHFWYQNSCKNGSRASLSKQHFTI